MVTGIERWKEYFNDYKDKYVLIGGAACNLLEEELDMNPRATKDLLLSFRLLQRQSLSKDSRVRCLFRRETQEEGSQSGVPLRQLPLWGPGIVSLETCT